MAIEVVALIVEAVTLYFLVFWTHALSMRFGVGYFYALLGGIAALAWPAKTGATLQLGEIFIVLGASVFLHFFVPGGLCGLCLRWAPASPIRHNHLAWRIPPCAAAYCVASSADVSDRQLQYFERTHFRFAEIRIIRWRIDLGYYFSGYFKKMTDIERELTDARNEIARRKAAEKERDRVIPKFQKTIADPIR